jgi:hypothetical protein
MQALADQHSRLCGIAAVQGERVQLRRVAVDLGWRMVAGWLRQLVAGRAHAQVLQWAPSSGKAETLGKEPFGIYNSEEAAVRRSTPAVGGAAAPAGVPQVDTTGGASSSSSQGLTHEVVAAAEQGRLFIEELTQVPGPRM